MSHIEPALRRLVVVSVIAVCTWQCKDLFIGCCTFEKQCILLRAFDGMFTKVTSFSEPFLIAIDFIKRSFKDISCLLKARIFR